MTRRKACVTASALMALCLTPVGFAQPANSRAFQLPMPWIAMDTLSQAQKDQIRALYVNKEITTYSAAIMQVAMATLHQEQWPAFWHAVSQWKQSVSIVDFKRVQARQANDVFCWAAAVQMLFALQKMERDQGDIAAMVLSKRLRDRATPQEICTGIGGPDGQWHITDEHRQDWTGKCNWLTQLPEPNWMVVQMEYQRPVLVGLRSSHHIVVIHQATFIEDVAAQPPVRLESVTYFDPYNGKSQSVEWKDFAADVAGMFDMFVVGPSARVFGPR